MQTLSLYSPRPLTKRWPTSSVLARSWRIGFTAVLCLFVATDVGALSAPILSTFSVLCLVVGACLLILLGLHLSMVRVMPFLLLLLFGFYTACNAWLTSDQSGMSFLISRNAFVLWFCAGAASGVAHHYEQQMYDFERWQTPFTYHLALLVCLALLLLHTPSDLFYQSMSNWIIVLVGIIIFGLSVSPVSLLNRSIALVFTCMLLLLSGVRGSNVSIAFALVLAFVFSATLIFSCERRARLRALAFALLIMLLFGFLLQYLSILGLIRIEYIQEEGFYISSLASRIELWKTFPDQFQVAPWSGSFSAELIAGPGPGYYQHSLPLSLLTHTGVLGTTLFTMGLCLVFLSRIRGFGLLYYENVTQILLISALIVSSIATFFSWLPLWFMLGISCVHHTFSFEKRP